MWKRKKSNTKHISDNGAYFNKANSNTYRTGRIYSSKNRKYIPYRSAYEYAYIMKLEKDESIISYISEPFEIKYINTDGVLKTYIPDLLVLHSDGSVYLEEIKPSAMTKALNVKRKASSARRYLKEFYPTAKYRFVTEESIFKSNKEYMEVLSKI